MNDVTVGAYYVGHRGRRFGPLTLADLTSRRLTAEMLVWCEGMPDWRPILEIEELRGFVAGSAGPAARSVGRPPDRGPSPGPVLALHDQPLAPPPLPPPTVPASLGRRRLMFVAIVTLVLACLGLVGCPLAIVAGLGLPWPGILESRLDPRTIALIRTVLHVVMFMVSVAMLIAGLGLLQRRRWGAVVAVTASVVCVACSLTGLVLECGVVQGPLLDVLDRGVDGGVPLGLWLTMSVINTTSGLASLLWHGTSVVILRSAAVRATLQ